MLKSINFWSNVHQKIEAVNAKAALNTCQGYGWLMFNDTEEFLPLSFLQTAGSAQFARRKSVEEHLSTRYNIITALDAF